MKSLFPGFYSPNSEEYGDLLNNGLIVLDTNVLLTLYRLPANAADALFKTLDIVKERLWIPHQVALEFHRNRISVISSEKKSTERTLKEVRIFVDNLAAKLDSLRLDERRLGIESQTLRNDLDKLQDKIVTAISSIHPSQVDVFSKDEILDKIEKLFEGRIGSGPKDQNELNSLIENGEKRYEKKNSTGI